jgi:hypothetical protein
MVSFVVRPPVAVGRLAGLIDEPELVEDDELPVVVPVGDTVGEVTDDQDPPEVELEVVEVLEALDGATATKLTSS